MPTPRYSEHRPPAASGQAEPALRVEAVTVAFREHRKGWTRRSKRIPVLHGIDLAVNAGETLAIVGESGSGKSTLLRTICGLVAAEAGRMWVEGAHYPLTSTNRRLGFRRTVQMVFQDPALSLDPRQRIGAMLDEVLALHTLADGGVRRGRAIELLGHVGLDASALERFPHSFSGGQRQRLAITRALAVEPRLLLCDEPVSALDVSVQAQVLNLLEALKRTFKLSMIFVTHDLAVAEWIADRILVLQHGRIVEEGPAADFHRLARTEYSRELIESVPEPPPLAYGQKRP